MARPIRNRARTSGRFSNREIVDCEHKLAIRRRQIERHLEHRVAAQGIGVDPVLVTGADHQKPKADDVRQAVRDLIGRAGIDHAGGEPIRDPKTLFDLTQRQHAAVRRQEPAVELSHNRFARNR